MVTATLKFTNPQAIQKMLEFNVDLAAIPNIVMWYMGFYLGDAVTVYVNGIKQPTDRDYGLVGDIVVLSE